MRDIAVWNARLDRRHRAHVRAPPPSRGASTSARVVMTCRSASPSPAMSAMIFWSFGLRITSSRRRSPGFIVGPMTARRSRSSRPQERVRQLAGRERRRTEAPSPFVSACARNCFRSTGSPARERDVAVVREELRDRPDFPRPLARAEERIDDRVPGLVGALRPDEDLRHDEDGLAPACAAPRRAHAGTGSPSIFPRRAPQPSPARALEEERGGRPFEHGALQVGGVARFVVRLERAQPPAPHRLEHPEPEVVREPDLREHVALRQVIEREEVDERQAPERVDDRPALIGLAHGRDPRRHPPRCARRSGGRATPGSGSARTRRALVPGAGHGNHVPEGVATGGAERLLSLRRRSASRRRA